MRSIVKMKFIMKYRERLKSGKFWLSVVKCGVLRVQSSVLGVWNLELGASFGCHYEVSLFMPDISDFAVRF